jgi:hypothetical protein
MNYDNRPILLQHFVCGRKGWFLPKISQQPENCENCNDPDLVQAFLKKWWVESDFKVPNLPLSLQLKVSGCHYNSIYNILI